MHRNRHSTGKCTDILPLAHECTEIIIPQVKAPESYPSRMNAPKSSVHKSMHRYPTPHTWIHRNHHPSSKCTGILPLTQIYTENRHSSSKCTDILPLTHECTEIIIFQVKAPESYPSHMNAPQIVTQQVNAPISYPSHMNAPKSSSLKYMHRNLTPHTWMHRNRQSTGQCTDILPLTHEYIEIIIPHVNAPESYLSHRYTPKSSLLR